MERGLVPRARRHGASAQAVVLNMKELRGKVYKWVIKVNKVIKVYKAIKVNKLRFF